MQGEPTQAQVRRIIEKHFVGAAVTNISRITEGYSHYMYLCKLTSKNGDQDVIVRINYNTKEDFTIGKELWVIEEYRAIGAPVPMIYGHDTSRSEFPFEYLIMEKLRGECLGSIWKTLTPQEKESLAGSMGKLLCQLHSVKTKTFGKVTREGVKPMEDFSFRSVGAPPKHSPWVAKVLHDAFSDLSGLVAYRLVLPEQASAIVQHLSRNIPLMEEADAVLVHNDFTIDHLFVEKKSGIWGITGICDFEFASSYAREFDFIKLHRLGLLNDPSIKAALLEGYGKERLHRDFDQALLLYRVVREIGFAYYTAKAGNLEKAKQTIDYILSIVKRA